MKNALYLCFFNTSIRVLFFHVGITALTQNVTHLFLVNNNIYVIVIIHLQMKRYVTFPTLHVPFIILIHCLSRISDNMHALLITRRSCTLRNESTTDLLQRYNNPDHIKMWPKSILRHFLFRIFKKILELHFELVSVLFKSPRASGFHQTNQKFDLNDIHTTPAY